jgi:nicotinate phosphoribosyltransferase
MFHIAGEEDIRKGRVTDVYFKRTEEILRSKKKNPAVTVEIMVKKFPEDYRWGILAGVEEVIRLLGQVDSVSVRCMPEGTYFREFEPVMLIKGKYLDFGVYETAILGFLCQASGIATRAARCKMLAGEKQIFSFGARRMHPAITPMIDRNAFIGGMDGVSTTLGAEIIGEEPVGTMPHALILIMGDTVEATRAFDEVIKPIVPRISLIDTFNDEKFEALRVTGAMGDRLLGIRLDTPSSRRGDFKHILEEIRWELDIRGYKGIKLVVSGGISENDIIELRDIVDSFGIGTTISSAPVLDFALDIVEIEGKPVAKRGKRSGVKKVLRCKNCGQDRIVLETKGKGIVKCEHCSGRCEDLFIDAVTSGKISYDFPPEKTIRDRVMGSFSFLEL